ncbi:MULTISPECIES: hypothetical protein [Legionella]|uniref:hypothetical protein n=1 Tax=Legionella TaxID=445 RepID=UPI0007312374|nr:hypothetical protein [Legionella maceachernii]
MPILTIVVQDNKNMSDQILIELKKGAPRFFTLEGLPSSSPQDYARKMIEVKFVTAENLNHELLDDFPYYKIMPITDISLGFYFDKDTVNLNEIHYFKALAIFADEYAESKRSLLLEKFPNRQAVLENPYRSELNEQRIKWVAKNSEQLRACNHSSAPTFFSKKESSNNRAKSLIIAGSLLGMVSFFLFFLEPISASLLAVAAVGFIFGGLANYGLENQEYSHKTPAI